jgi:hypothetical protein
MLNRLPRTLPGEYIVAVGTLSPVLALPSALAFVASSWFIAQAIRAASMTSSASSMATAGVLVTMVYGLGCMALAIGFAVRAFVTWMTTTFVVTNRRVVSASGLLRRVEVELPLSSVTGVIVRQHLLRLGVVVWHRHSTECRRRSVRGSLGGSPESPSTGYSESHLVRIIVIVGTGTLVIYERRNSHA